MDAFTDDFWDKVQRGRERWLARQWTDERVCKLREMHAAKTPYPEIAKELGVTRNAVCGKVKRLGLSVPMSERVRVPRVQKSGWRRAKPKPKVRPERLALYEMFSVVDYGLDLSLRTELSCDILGLTRENCHWPVGDPGTDGFFFCGQEAVKGHSYCGAHCRIAYTRVKGARQPFRNRSGTHRVGAI